MTNYRVLDLDMVDPDAVGYEFDEALAKMEETLYEDGWEYFITNDPYAGQLIQIVVPANYVDGIFTQFDELLAEYGLTYTAR